MRRHRDSVFNRTINAYLRRVAERALRRDRVFAGTDTAVILVACQNDLLASDGRGRDLSAGPEASGVVDTLARLLDVSRAHGLRVVYAPQAMPANGKFLTPIQSRMRAGGLFQPGSWGAEIHDRLAPAAGDDVRPPHMGMSAFAGTDLLDNLRAAGVARVAIAGALADVQVDSTARDAVESGFQTVVIADACLASSEANWSRVIETNLPRVAHAVLPFAAFTARLAREPPERHRGHRAPFGR